MRNSRILLAATCLSLGALGILPAAADGPEAPRSLASLVASARNRKSTTARVPLLPETAEVFRDVETLEPAGSGRVPSYLRALSTLPNSVKPMGHLVKTFLTRGSVQPEIKLAMGLKIAQLDGSPYVAVHLNRLLNASEDGRRLAQAVASQGKGSLSPEESAALAFANALGRGPRELDDAEFRKLRTWYNDAQVVELTMTVSFFAFFDRYCEGLNLPVEPWALETAASPLPEWHAGTARVSLTTDQEVKLFRDTAERATASARPEPGKDSAAARNSLGIGIANSQRAMVRAPEHMDAWFGFWSAARESQLVNRNDKLQVSFAVSMVNGCRYCTVHQVVGLRRLGVDPAKLVAMRKDDAVLTPRERAAVLFARKLTRSPASVTDADYRTLVSEFTEPGAVEVLLQTSTFNFMNRLTDGLRLPSEDEAIRSYQEVYGPGSYEGYRNTAKSGGVQ